MFFFFWGGGGDCQRSKRYIYLSDTLHFVESHPERDAEYQKGMKG